MEERMIAMNFKKRIVDFDRIYYPISKINCMLYQLNTDLNLAYTGLLPKQVDAVKAAMSGDVLVVLPTGYGKSLIYQLLPYLTDPPRPVVVASPLNAIIAEQSARLSSLSLEVDNELIDALKINDHARLSPEMKAKIVNLLNQKYLYLIGHPEQLIQPLFKNMLLKLQATFLVVDEAHCVLSWGKSQFRPAFLQLQSLKCFMPGAKTIALTATASSDNQKELEKLLLLKSPTTVHLPPDRSKIFLEVLRRPANAGGEHTVEASYDSILLPILTELVQKQRLFPKTVIYMPIQWCAYAHTMACRMLGLDLDQPDTVDNDELDSFVAQYHAPQGKQMKNLITRSMQKANSKLCLLFATEAYGMGADSPNIRRVVHVGPPNTMETYVQEIGRAGRDGEPATAQMYVNAADLGQNKKHLTESLRQFCKLTTCRRAFLLNYFGGQYMTVVSPGHKCCDNCLKCCDCDECIMTASDVPIEEPTVTPVVCNLKVCKEAKQEAEDFLLQYFDYENTCVGDGQILPEALTGLSLNLAKSISADPFKYLDISRLAEDFDIDNAFLENIVHILQCVTNAYLEA